MSGPSISLRHIEVFHAIMRTGSITGAARMLNVTQPAVSAVLKHFETRLGMKLFERAGGGLQPTPEAQALLPDVSEIFARLGEVERLTQDLVGGSLGRLNIAATSPVANGYLAKAVATFMAKRPGVQVTLQALASPQVLDRVVNREVDLGVAYEPIVNPVVDTEVLMRASIACVLPESHPLAARAEIGIQDLAEYPLVTYLPHALLRPYVDRAFSEAGLAPSISVEVGLSLTGMMLAFHGAGIALVEPYLLSTMPLPGLVSRPLQPRVELKCLMLRHKSVLPSRVLKDFIAHLRATIPADHLDRS